VEKLVKLKRIGVDLDEVLADFLATFIKFHNQKFGTKLIKEQFSSFHLHEIIGEKVEVMNLRIEEFYDSLTFEELKPVEGAIDAIEYLSQKYELIIITSRPKNVSEHTIKWLKRHFPEKFKNVHFAYNPYISESEQKTKSDIASENEIDLFIEDNIDLATGVAGNGITVYLIDAPWNQSGTLHENITRVYSWKEILERIEKLR
jgi:uncharacterized HAD superfamily protein